MVSGARLPPSPADGAFSILRLGPEALERAPQAGRGPDRRPRRVAVSPHLQPGRQPDHPGRLPARHRRLGGEPRAGDPGRRPPERPVRRLGDLDALAPRGDHRGGDRARRRGRALWRRRPDRGGGPGRSRIPPAGHWTGRRRLRDPRPGARGGHGADRRRPRGPVRIRGGRAQRRLDPGAPGAGSRGRTADPRRPHGRGAVRHGPRRGDRRAAGFGLSGGSRRGPGGRRLARTRGEPQRDRGRRADPGRRRLAGPGLDPGLRPRQPLGERRAGPKLDQPDQ